MGKIQKALARVFEDQKELGLINQRQIAKRVGKSTAYVSSLLAGDRRFNEELIESFCVALNIRFSDLDDAEKTSHEPAEIRRAVEQLRQLYRLNHDSGFLSVARSIEDWLKAANARSNETIAKAHETIAVKPESKAQESETKSVARETVVEFPQRKTVTLTNLDAPRPAVFVQVPFAERIPANKPGEVWVEPGMWVDVLHSSAKPGWWATRVWGDSMLPEYRDGDIVLMDRDQAPKDGDIVAALIDESDVTLKVFSRQGEDIILTPLNRKKYKVQRYHASRVTIQGVLVELVRRPPNSKRKR